MTDVAAVADLVAVADAAAFAEGASTGKARAAPFAVGATDLPDMRRSGVTVEGARRSEFDTTHKLLPTMATAAIIGFKYPVTANATPTRL